MARGKTKGAPNKAHRTGKLAAGINRRNAKKASSPPSSRKGRTVADDGQNGPENQQVGREAAGMALPDSVSVNSFAALAEQGLSVDEIMAQLLETRVNLSDYRSNIADLMRIGRSRGRGKLKMAYFETARKGGVTALQSMLAILADSATAATEGSPHDLGFERIVLPSSRA